MSMYRLKSSSSGTEVDRFYKEKIADPAFVKDGHKGQTVEGTSPAPQMECRSIVREDVMRFPP